MEKKAVNISEEICLKRTSEFCNNRVTQVEGAFLVAYMIAEHQWLRAKNQKVGTTAW